MEYITKENYRNYPAINQSTLKMLEYNPKGVRDAEQLTWSEGLEFGDVLDLILFTPDEFDKKYYVTNMDNLPSEKVKIIIETVISTVKEGDYEEEDILQAADIFEYGKNWNPETRIRKILEDGGGAKYASQLIKSRNKKLLSIDHHMHITQASEVLKSHEFTSHLIHDKLPTYMERLTQVPLLAPYNKNPNVFYKGLLDLIIIDHNSKTIYPWDVKSTSSEVLSFPYQFLKFRYDLQASLYTYLLNTIIESVNDENNVIDYGGLTFNPKGYKVENFGFIVISSKNVNYPVVYKCTDEDLDRGLYGGTSKKGISYKGVFTLTDELLWHRKTSKWDYPKEVYDNKGELLIDVY